MMVYRDIESRGTVIPRRDYRQKIIHVSVCQGVCPEIPRGMRAPPRAPLYARTRNNPIPQQFNPILAI